MSDLIDRQAAIKALMNNEPYSWNNDDYERGEIARFREDVTIIKNVPSVRQKRKPSAQPEPRWIPVTERLPEDGDRRKFLLSIKWYDDIDDESYECVDDLQYFWIYGKWYDVKEHKEFDDFYTITAWMPLPEPYREEEP